MKILYVTPRYRPHTGGVETHVSELAARFTARGHEVTVVSADARTTVDDERLPRRERRDGVEVRRIRGVAPNGAFHFAPGVYIAVRNANADVVHAHNYHSLPLLFAALGTDETPFIVTPHYHGGSASSVRDRLLSTYRPLGRWALRRADTVIAVSEWEHNQLRRDFGIEGTVIPNGIDVARFRSADPEKRDRPYLLTVGRLEEYKGIQYVIEALSELCDHGLLVAGDGPYREALEATAREMGVADRVDFLGYVDEERLPRLYAGAEVYLSLSSFEAYGMTVAEALASGTPCVVAEAGALSEWTSRPNCIGIPLEAIGARNVAMSVRDAAGRPTIGECPPDWEEVVDRLGLVYERAASHSSVVR